MLLQEGYRLCVPVLEDSLFGVSFFRGSNSEKSDQLCGGVEADVISRVEPCEVWG